jgi:CHRD domain
VSNKIWSLVVLAVAGLVAAAVAVGAAPPPTTFVAVLNADDEVPHCAAATDASRGLAIFHVVDEATGTVRYKLVANNLPGTPVAAHIHLAPKGTAGGIVQALMLMPGEENGVIGEGTFTNPALVAALQANPQAYYVNVHTNVCPLGVIRDQLGEHGPPGTAEP